MKLLIFLLTLTSLRSSANSSAICDQVNGGHSISLARIDNFKLETIVDIFTLRNANTLSFDLEEEAIRLTRKSMEINRETKMTFVQKKNNEVLRSVNLIIDRTPRKVIVKREFYVAAFISSENPDEAAPLYFKFYCSF
jgi:hypothetical protein